jgi:proteasome lid subunit RPN8/RPN11
MMSHAVQSDPEECCGLIVGGDGERFRHVYRCHNDMTAQHNDDPVAFPRDNRSGFYVRGADILHAEREAERRGLRVTAVYHSHVGARAYLSETDLEYAEHELSQFPNADWIVLAVFERSVREVALFRRRFVGHRVPVGTGAP